MITTTRLEISVSEPTLYVAFELSKKEWKLALTSGFGVEPWVRSVAAGDVRGVEDAVRQGRRRFGLPAAALVVSCYEAGRDGFWIHRALTQRGIRNRVVDSASIEVNRRARRAKTDRLDALKLVRMLVRVCAGDRRAWSEVRVPTVAEEAARQVSRERTALTQEQTRLTNQMRGWLATWGGALPRSRRSGWWTAVSDWAGAPLPLEVPARLARAAARLAVLENQIAALDGQQQAAVTAAAPASALRQLVRLKSRRRARRCCSTRGSCGARSAIAARSVGSWALRRRPTTAGSRSESKGSVAPAITGCKRSAFSWRGIGCAGNRSVPSRSGIGSSSDGGSAPAGLGLWRWRASSSSRCGGMSRPGWSPRARS